LVAAWLQILLEIRIFKREEGFTEMGNNHKFANIGLNMQKNKVVKTGIIFSQNIKTTTIYKCVRP
jgi:hypothetical protein